jgi:hypothetical protein
VILLMGSTLYALWICCSPSGWYMHDFHSHLQYIDYVYKYGAAPNPAEGYLSYHPPGYYLLAGALKLLILDTMSWDILIGLRVFSVVCFNFFLAYSIKTLQLFLPRDTLTYWLTVILILAWPSNLFQATCIDSNLLLLAITTPCLYHICCWQRSKELQSLKVVIYLLSLGLLIRTNILPLFAVACLSVISAIISTPRKSLDIKASKILLPLFCLILSFTGNFGRTFYYRYFVNHNHKVYSKQPLIVGNAIKRKDRWNSVTATDFIYLDLNYYLKVPFLAHPGPAPGAKNYWNWLLKSSLYGKWHHNSSITVAKTLALLLLLLVFFTIASRIFVRPPLYNPIVPLYMLTMLASSYLLRLSLPSEFNSGDFRYIYPLMPCLLIYYGSLLEGWKRTKVFAGYHLGVFLGSIFLFASIIFLIQKYEFFIHNLF